MNMSRRRGKGGGFPSIKQLVSSRSHDEDDDAPAVHPTARRQPSPSPPPPPPPIRRDLQQQRSTRTSALQQKAAARRQGHQTAASNRGRQTRRKSDTNNGDSVFSGLTTAADEDSHLSGRATIMGGDAATLAPLQKIERVYGPSANVYTDVLKVSPQATPGEIREAFFCLRYDIYQKLDAGGTSGGAPGSEALTSDERKEVEARMDAITGAFHILSDGGRRRAYDASLVATSKKAPARNESITTAATDELGFPVATTGGGPHSPSKLSPSKADRTAAHLPIGQRRSVFRRNRAAHRRSAGSGMNPGRRAVAEDVSGGLNTRPNPSADGLSFDAEDGNDEGNWTDFNSGSGGKGAFGREARDDARGSPTDSLNAREQMLQRAAASRHANDSTAAVVAEDLASPTGVGEFENADAAAWSRKATQGDAIKETVAKAGRNGTDDDAEHGERKGRHVSVAEDAESLGSQTYDDDTRTYGDDTRTYDDDTRTYDDDSQTYDDTTIGESTWASEYDDDTTAYEKDLEDGAKFSPGHKKGTVPQPILKSSSGAKNVKRSDSDKRVTIHSHRRSASEGDADFSLFDGAACPIPSCGALADEVVGSYQDFTAALHQVGNAFVISPDDIDRMSDKIRDAKIELGENYHRQVKERQDRSLTAK